MDCSYLPKLLREIARQPSQPIHVKLPPPTVPLAFDNQLDPTQLSAPTFVAKLAFAEMSPEWHYSILVFQSNGMLLHQAFPQRGDPSKELRFNIPTGDILTGLGEKITFYSYMPDADGGGISTGYEVAVLPITEDDLRTPVVLAADGGQYLHVDDLVSNPSVQLYRWPMITKDQKIWLKINGVHEDGTPTTMELAVANPLTQDDVEYGFTRFASMSQLQRFQDHSTAKVEAKVLLNPRSWAEEAQAVPFPVLALTIIRGHKTT